MKSRSLMFLRPQPTCKSGFRQISLTRTRWHLEMSVQSRDTKAISLLTRAWANLVLFAIASLLVLSGSVFDSRVVKLLRQRRIHHRFSTRSWYILRNDKPRTCRIPSRIVMLPTADRVCTPCGKGQSSLGSTTETVSSLNSVGVNLDTRLIVMRLPYDSEQSCAGR
jgi:hypothetical protein